MALSFTNGLTSIASGDSTANYSAVRWNGSGSAPGVAAADDWVEGTGAIQSKLAGNNWDAAVIFDYFTANGSTVLNLSTSGNEVICGFFRYGLKAAALAVASGGMKLVVSSSTETGTSTPTVYSEWYLGGNDYYPVGPNGWYFFCVDTRKTPSNTVGGGASLSTTRRIGVGIANLGALGTIKGEPFYLDAMWYGRPLYTLTGDGVLTADWDDFITESETTVADGLIQDIGGAYHLRCGIQFGTDAQTSTTTFADASGKSMIFKRVLYHTGTVYADALTYSDIYKIEGYGAASFNTSVTFGSVVGSGDARQGVLGGSIKSEDSTNITWSLNFQTDIAHLSAAKFYGIEFQGAKGGLLFDGKTTAADSSVISVNFINSGAVGLGDSNDGVELLNAAIIDPLGDTNNYGLHFDQTPAVGVLTHRVKNISLITSGTPSTQYMLQFDHAGDYELTLNNVQVFGSFTSGTLWHGINSGSNADVTINAQGTTNLIGAEFSNTAGGTMTVVSNPVTTTVTCRNINTDVAIEGAAVTVRAGAVGPLPFEDSVTIAQTGGTATVTHSAHGFSVGQQVEIEGADQNNYNRIKTILTTPTANSYTFAVDSGTVSPATGTITATAIVINGLTNASGVISDTRAIATDQDISGYSAKGTGLDLYKRTPISTTIDSANGVSQTVLMQPD